MMKEILDFLTGRSSTRTAADRENMQRDDAKVVAGLDALVSITETNVAKANEFSIVVTQLVKDLGYERKGKSHAKAAHRSHKA